MARVSVIIPTYNCDAYLEEAVQSVFGQTYRDYEVIVSDDGSTDSTRRICERWGTKVRYLFQENHGVSSARNLGVAHSTGEFLAYLDADDRWYPERLARQVEFLDTNPNCALVHSDVSVIDENGSLMVQAFNRQERRAVPQGQCMTDLVKRCHIQLATVMERRVSYEQTGGFNEAMRFGEDYLHWMEVAASGWAFGYIDAPLAMYRRRSGSASTNEGRMMEGIARALGMMISSGVLRNRFGAEAEELAQSRRHLLVEALPYRYRQEGRCELAIASSLEAIRIAPGRYRGYVELGKSLICRLRRR